MMSRIKSLLFSLPFTLAGTVALAEEVPFADGKGYVGLETGLVLLGDVGIGGGGTAGNGITYSGSGEFQFDNGFGLGFIAGYRLSDWITAEVEGAYSSVDYDNLTGSLTASNETNTSTISGTVDIDGQITALSGVFNLLLTPKITDGDTVRPFVGVGAGVLSYDDEIDSINGVAVDGSESDTVFAYQFKAGFDVDVSDGFSVGASYSYVGAETGDSITDDATIQRLMLRGVLNF